MKFLLRLGKTPNRTGPAADIRAKSFGHKFNGQFSFHVSGRVMRTTINNKGMSSSKKKGFSAGSRGHHELINSQSVWDTVLTKDPTMGIPERSQSPLMY